MAIGKGNLQKYFPDRFEGIDVRKKHAFKNSSKKNDTAHCDAAVISVKKNIALFEHDVKLRVVYLPISPAENYGNVSEDLKVLACFINTLFKTLPKNETAHCDAEIISVEKKILNYVNMMLS